MALPLKSRIGRAVRSALGIEQAPYRRVSYAQEGEDLLLARFFGGQPNGFYVNVGAHDPLRFFGSHAGEAPYFLFDEPLTAFMNERGYAIYAKTLNSVLFAREAPQLLS